MTVLDRIIPLVVLLAGLRSALAESQAPVPADAVAIEHVTVIPMDRDTALADFTVLTWNGRIGWVGPSRQARIPSRARRIDGRGRWVVPGLVDMHVHLDRFTDLPLYLDAGITTVRNMRGRPEHLAWRAQVETGALEGPTILTSGPTCCRSLVPVMTNPAFVLIRTPADADSLAQQQARSGYDMIKLHSRITVPQFEHLTATARSLGIPVVGHLVPEIGLERSLAAGQRSLEHATGLTEDDSVMIDRAARRIASAGAWVGTIIASQNGRCDPPTPKARRTIGGFRRARVKLLAGSDAGLSSEAPGSVFHCELVSLVAAGLTPYEALAAATRNAGEFAATLTRSKPTPFGTVVAGSRADLLLLGADPRIDIGAVADPIGIMVRGRWQDRTPGRSSGAQPPN